MQAPLRFVPVIALLALLIPASPAAATEVDPLEGVRDLVERCFTRTAEYVDPLENPAWHVDGAANAAVCAVGWAHPKAGYAAGQLYGEARDRTPLDCWMSPYETKWGDDALYWHYARVRGFAWCAVEHALQQDLPEPRDLCLILFDPQYTILCV